MGFGDRGDSHSDTQHIIPEQARQWAWRHVAAARIYRVSRKAGRGVAAIYSAVRAIANKGIASTCGSVAGETLDADLIGKSLEACLCVLCRSGQSCSRQIWGFNRRSEMMT